MIFRAICMFWVSTTTSGPMVGETKKRRSSHANMRLEANRAPKKWYDFLLIKNFVELRETHQKNVESDQNEDDGHFHHLLHPAQNSKNFFFQSLNRQSFGERKLSSISNPNKTLNFNSFDGRVASAPGTVNSRLIPSRVKTMTKNWYSLFTASLLDAQH